MTIKTGERATGAPFRDESLFFKTWREKWGGDPSSGKKWADPLMRSLFFCYLSVSDLGGAPRVGEGFFLVMYLLEELTSIDLPICV